MHASRSRIERRSDIGALCIFKLFVSFLGGIAGGDKFIKDSIFFKFNLNESGTWYFCWYLLAYSRGIYGSSAFAFKASKRELANSILLFESFYLNNSASFRVPLFCIVEYCGYQVSCVGLLPIQTNSLWYVSNISPRITIELRIFGWCQKCAY